MDHKARAYVHGKLLLLDVYVTPFASLGWEPTHVALDWLVALVGVMELKIRETITDWQDRRWVHGYWIITFVVGKMASFSSKSLANWRK